MKDSIMFPFPNLVSLLDLIIVAINGNCMDDTYGFGKSRQVFTLPWHTKLTSHPVILAISDSLDYNWWFSKWSNLNIRVLSRDKWKGCALLFWYKIPFNTFYT